VVPTSANDAEQLLDILHQMTDVSKHLRQAGVVVGCYLADDTTDKEALLLLGEINSLNAIYTPVALKFHQTLAMIEDAVWEALLATAQLREYESILNKCRDKVSLKLTKSEENTITALSIDEYEAWRNLYNQLVSDIQVEIEVDGEKKQLSVGQASNLSSHPDARIRKEA